MASATCSIFLSIDRLFDGGLRVWNSIPEESGFSADRATETCDQAADLLRRLGLYGELYEPKPVSFTTLGSMEGATKCRKIVFEEILDGLPVRWSAEALYFEDNGAQAYRNYAEVIYSDEEGLLMMEAYWCAFEPAIRTDTILSPEAAVERFASVGIKASVRNHAGSSVLMEMKLLRRLRTGLVTTI